MVSFHATALTAGRSVSQCAETTRMALGRGNNWPSPERKLRAGVSVNGNVSAPWDRNRLGMVIWSSPGRGRPLGCGLKFSIDGVAYREEAPASFSLTSL